MAAVTTVQANTSMAVGLYEEMEVCNFQHSKCSNKWTAAISRHCASIRSMAFIGSKPLDHETGPVQLLRANFQ